MWNIYTGSAHGNWFMQPWAWLPAAVIFILLLASLLKSNRSKTK